MVCCSIILPSRNGADTLPLVLDALAQLERVEGGVEILLVDNGSTDDTKALMARFAAGGRAIVLDEPRAGKSHALNTGIANATGDLLIFLDDDAIPSEQWLASYLDAAESFPDAGAYAGAIAPHWLGPAPEWLAALADKGRACGCTAPEREAGPIAPDEVKGANFAVRRDILGDERFETGAVNFGQGKLAIGGEDSMMARALVRRGATFRFVPAAKVEHIISQDEMKLAFQLGRFARIGRGAAAMRKGGALEAAKAAGRTAVWMGQAGLRLAMGRRGGAAESLTRAAQSWGGFTYRVRKGAK
ncbi:glycosyltransferase [Qipengyuania sp. 1NDH17]|uniref:Glycosyltransferase n=1 Tax=Qipengyuania polymorpha TaxID=2867234 RepID=A0ABS7IWI6_9SPHN|nr:glycosyltransferase family 2 protein [Qipengyuania polymorpha]MBX7457693.1 glycosyltransferase [Qipengyuania polymorpha]